MTTHPADSQPQARQMLDVQLRIKRFNPEVDERPHWETYTVQCDSTDRVLDALHKVKWELDGTLSFRRSCAHGVCGSDAIMINGANALACTKLLRDTGSHVTVEPIRGLPVLKDLIVDMEPFFAKYRSVLPYLIRSDDDSNAPASPSNSASGRERLQTPEEHARYNDSTKCILCAACTTSCPVFWANDDYVGPAAIVQAHRFLFDSRDDAPHARLNILAADTGAFRCRTSFNCSAACPREINVTEAVEEVKRAIVRGKR